jgi:hypothetical protein
MTTVITKAAQKAWEEYDPEFSIDDEGNQQLHKEGKEAFFHYDDIEEAFLEAFWLGFVLAAEMAARGVTK